ncbi:MAG: hypothetical protein K8I27_15600 [Planctomycetes bacterium]|nr:hypothetical protein [Planctomycetota bacterium]
MQNLITAAAAVLLVGIGAFSAAHTDAQRTTRGEVIEKDGEIIIVEEEVKPGAKITWAEKEDGRTTPGAPWGLFAAPSRPGTWQVITHDDVILLLNTATGETFHLDDNDDGMFWKPIPRPDMRPMPALPRPEGDRRPQNAERVEQRLKELRKQLKNARGEDRQRLERAIEEIERAREEGEPRGEGQRDRDADRERHLGELEDVINEIEEEVSNLKVRFEKSDSVREREKIENAIRELKQEAERVRKELKELHR